MPDRVGATTVAWAAWAAVLLLISAVVAFAVIRVMTDLPLVFAGRAAENGSFEERYVRNAVPAYLHIVPGVIYLVGACFQLSRRFRERHWPTHRRLGRTVLVAGIVSGSFALVFGVPHSYGGFWQSVATVVFSSYFLVALGLAFRAIVRRDVRNHRRWMIRAFAVGLAVGTIRLWVGVLVGFGDIPLQQGFAPAFWLAFSMHVAAAEVWLRWASPMPLDR
ncbi:DUF2306 domain-containing protein [Mumia qirimensis]|uniref:DUF2306 domain-containing protein n=1 Tax=Mumia qirimensis TaxID=3234852 RepID=UPI00351D7A38